MDSSCDKEGRCSRRDMDVAKKKKLKKSLISFKSSTN